MIHLPLVSRRFPIANSHFYWPQLALNAAEVTSRLGEGQTKLELATDCDCCPLPIPEFAIVAVLSFPHAQLLT